MRHGGDLAAAEAAFGRPAKGWLDLSTGVNPHAYPLKPFSATALTRLPDPEHVKQLLVTARRAYGWKPDVPVVAGPGAQAMIQLLPYLRVRGSVLVIGPTYGEHAYLWARAGHQVREAWSLSHAEESQVVVLVNPDNPSGRTTEPDVLLKLAADLAKRDGLLVVDESFADVSVETSMAERVGPKGLVVLRSLGKFYGLAGLRLGFAAGDAEMISELSGELGPWPVSGPALEAGRAALADDAWAVSTRLQLTVEAMRLDAILTDAGFEQVRGCDLFRTVRHPAAGTLHRQLARAGVWCRAFDDRPDQLRFGLPPDDEGFERLKAELSSALKTAA
ncbi:threonine-phosphate decarboxylase CobD [Methylopila sp. M107]|uniref:threonine-phosphate decarboxylase CobD n=1 Tax=Methylopila sp. M107 TaxID=1101190 RepID=UPI000380345B|nr:threonine-phosphate decarboxylase CobD [Methylopila sp. M107]